MKSTWLSPRDDINVYAAVLHRILKRIVIKVFQDTPQMAAVGLNEITVFSGKLDTSSRWRTKFFFKFLKLSDRRSTKSMLAKAEIFLNSRNWPLEALIRSSVRVLSLWDFLLQKPLNNPESSGPEGVPV